MNRQNQPIEEFTGETKLIFWLKFLLISKAETNIAKLKTITIRIGRYAFNFTLYIRKKYA